VLFDLRPKNRREEIFDREKEFKDLEKSVEVYPMTIILGIRRVGKSSILRAYLNENPGILIDCRNLYAESGYLTKEDLIRNLQSKAGLLNKITSKFKISVNLKFLTIEPGELSLREIFEELNRIGEKTGKFIIAFDEAQYLRFYGSRGGRELLALFAYAYDNLPNLRLILTGSEIGLLHDFLSITNYESSLYGRPGGEIIMKPFDKKTSIEFLKYGFNEAKVEIDEEEIKKAVEILDGVPGWLVIFGVEYLKNGNFEKAIQRTFEIARGLVVGELKELKKRSPRYVEILKSIALGYNRWSLIRDYLKVRGDNISDPRLYALIENLKKMSWIVEEDERYKIADPVVATMLKS